MITDSLKKIISYSWKNKVVTAKSISLDLGLEKSTVSRNISKLREKNILIKTDELSPSNLGGRKTIVYSFNEKLGHILGISVEQDGIECVKTDLFSNVLDKKKIVQKINEKNIAFILREIVKENEDILGVGISIPGIIENNTVVFSEALSLKNFDLEKTLLLDIPIFVEKDSICGATRYSLESKNIVYFQLSVPYYVNEPVGLGVGIVIDGKPYYGHSNFSGEYKLNKSIYNKKVSYEEFLKKSVSLDEFFEDISKKIGQISSILDPEVVVIGGNITLIPGIENLRDFVVEQVYMYEHRKMKIIIEDAKEFVNAEGAAINVLKNMFLKEEGIEYFCKKVILNE